MLFTKEPARNPLGPTQGSKPLRSALMKSPGRTASFQRKARMDLAEMGLDERTI